MNTTAVGHLRPLLVPTLFEKVLPLPIPVIVPIMVTSRIERIFEIFKAMIGLPSSVNLSDSERVVYVVVTVSAIYFTHFCYRKIYGIYAKNQVNDELELLKKNWGDLQKNKDRFDTDLRGIPDTVNKKFFTEPFERITRQMQVCVLNLNRINKFKDYLPQEKEAEFNKSENEIQRSLDDLIKTLKNRIKEPILNHMVWDPNEPKKAVGELDTYVEDIAESAQRLLQTCREYYTSKKIEFPAEHTRLLVLWNGT